ncbi:probable RNA polymerase II nuclear localization protein SLC7A6OS [Leguminivora glycinivorella]|uniref:probable RNA polymerase II nuclear localization protein SLC7A6OS n=1 Tax=Leguminivora glycinivorella TaxID=1035111 RepID=UPI00200CD808|nr:probable RNA polymerase II nuclear localization protein SLC7A6OS [Leguminivora glycinivorella]
MATSTILRVKRHLEDNPQDALVLMCKRMKTDVEEVSPSLFVFRGTVDNQETANVKDIVPKTDAKLKSTHNVTDIIDKLRKERKVASSGNRYEVVNCHRGLKEASDEFDLVDLERKDQKEDEQYAYDLYTAAKQDFDISMLDNLVSIEHYETDLIFGTYRDNGEQSSDDADDDDDSNDENNWRNDYPDEEEDSIDEEDMVRAVERCGIESDLSSDAGEDHIYDGPADINNEDALRYGAAYAAYKARVLAGGKGTGKEFAYCREIDDVDAKGYKDDSDDGFYYGQEEDTQQFREQYSSDEPD